MTPRASIVVGFDGSPNSVAALNCALVEANLRNARIMLCHVREPTRHLADRARTVAARQLLARGTEHAHRRLPSIDVTAKLLTGNPAQQLLRVATDARLLVVGARGSDGSRDLRLGPVSFHIARHSYRPVVVVPDVGKHTAAIRRRVVVGVDTSTTSEAAVLFAFEEALRRGAAVRAVHVFDPSASRTDGDVSQPRLRRLRLVAAAATRDLLARYAARYPGVRACAEVVSGSPGVALAAAARDSELLIVGTRRDRETRPLTSGVTGSAVLHNATCPIAIV